MDVVLRALMVSAPRLLTLPNVVGVGSTYKHKNGESTGKPALAVLVTRKVPRGELLAKDVVPESIDEARTDVIEVGEIVALGLAPNISRTGRHRPAMPGVSIGHFKVSAGTFGAVVYDKKDGAPLILSNNHVLANCTNGRDAKAKAGDEIWQPGKYDGGSEKDTIGVLHRFAPMKMEVISPECRVASTIEKSLNWAVKYFRRTYGVKLYKVSDDLNLVDAAVAKPLRWGDIDTAILGIGVPSGTAEADVGDMVIKSGRTSGLNRGVVKVVQATIKVGMGEAGDAVFGDQVVVTHMAQPGDSGSLVVNERNQAVGLLSAGSDTVSVFARMANVCEALSVRI